MRASVNRDEISCLGISSPVNCCSYADDDDGEKTLCTSCAMFEA